MSIIEIILLIYSAIVTLVCCNVLALLFKSIKTNKDIIMYKSGRCLKCNTDFLHKKTGFFFTEVDKDFLKVAVNLLEENEKLKANQKTENE